MRASLGANIQIAGVDRDRDPSEALGRRAREQGTADDLLTIQADLTTDTAAEEITGATRARFGRIVSWSKLPRSAPVPSGRTGSAPSGSGRSRLISGAASLHSTPRGPSAPDERRRARDDAPGLGSDRQRHD